MGFDSKNTNTAMDEIITPGFPAIERGQIVLSGQTLVRGSVVGKVTASSKMVLLDKDAVDGSEVPFGVVADYIDASAGDKVGPIWRTGEFLAEKLIFEAGTVLSDVQAAMEAIQLWPKVMAEETP